MANGNWSEIAAELETLKVQAPADLGSVLERLQRAAVAENRPYDSTLVRAMIELVKDVMPRVNAGQPSSTAVQTATAAATFAQEGWSPEIVTNAGQIIVNLLGGLDSLQTPQTPQSLSAPVVLAAMTEDQAGELRDGSAFVGYPSALADDFTSFQTFLDQEGASDWWQRYGRDASVWRPFGVDRTIEAVLEQTFGEVNRAFRFEPPLAPSLVELDALNDDRFRLRRLRHEGCLVIVDSISMRHPTLQRAFHHSLLDAYPRTSVVLVAPVDRPFERSRELSIVLQLRVRDLEFAKRERDFTEEMEILETADEAMFVKWMARGISKLASSLGASPGIRSFMTFSAS